VCEHPATIHCRESVRRSVGASLVALQVGIHSVEDRMLACLSHLALRTHIGREAAVSSLHPTPNTWRLFRSGLGRCSSMCWHTGYLGRCQNFVKVETKS
jgi:hypothetical protein